MPSPTAAAFSRRRFLLAAGLLVAGGHVRGEETGAGVHLVRARPGTPGPTLRARRGEELAVRLINETAEPTALHWHGVRIANAMDGVPGLTQAPVAPGATFDYRFVVPDAGTFWYHPPPRAGGRPLDSGYGALIVQERATVDVDHDVLLLVDHLPAPVQEIAVKPNERVRLRLINALGNAMLPLRLDRHRVMVMAIDGQPAEPFAARDGRVVLGPGNRADLFIDATAANTPLVVETDSGDRAIAQLRYEPSTAAQPFARPDVTVLPTNGLPEKLDLAGALRVDLAMETSAPALAPEPLFSVTRGRTVVLAFANGTANPFVLHLHGHHFRLLDRLDDGWKPFWLDTVVVPEQQTWRIAFQADNPGKWLIQRYPLSEPQNGGATWFEVM
jgi:FtsP/CotA-like multicopper oxidase with cupredoxin domain